MICPLNWGLGHATRCIPLIAQWQELGCEVTLAASGRPLALLRQRFPSLRTIEFPDYHIRVPKSKRLILHLLIRWPWLLYHIRAERKTLQRLIAQHHFDVIVSDNRYGLWSPLAHCILITHQIMLKAPKGFRFGEGIVHRKLLRQFQHFDEIWIPDVEGVPNLSGDLSHQYPLPPHARYIGWMSRFAVSPDSIDSAVAKNYDITVLISGPEPQRSYFEDILVKQMRELKGSFCIIRGCPDQPNRTSSEAHIDFVNHADDAALTQIIRSSRCLICRPGYSTLMDLIYLGKSAVLVPTPGQTEQIYLGERMHAQGWFVTQPQSSLRLSSLLDDPSENRSPKIDLQGKTLDLASLIPIAGTTG